MYGLGIKVLFKEGVYLEKLKIESGGGVWCCGVFKFFMMVGILVKVGMMFWSEIEVVNYEDFVFVVYKIDKRGVEYIIDDMC